MLVRSDFVASVIAGAVLIPLLWAGWEVRRRLRIRRGHGTLRGARLVFVRSVAAAVTVAGVLAATAAAVNYHYSYILNFSSLTGHFSRDLNTKPHLLAAGTGATTLVPHGVVEKFPVWGTVSGLRQRPTYIYLPPQYFAERHRRFPVLYLMHGSPGISADWIRTGRIDHTMDGLLRTHTVRPFIIVMPDFDLGYLRDTQCEDIAGGPKMQTYLVTDVVHYVDTHFRTIADRGDRAIGGFSAGAYCGMNLALRHQDVFSAFVSQSGYTRPDHSKYTGKLFGGSRTLRSENTPQYYLPTVPITRPFGAYVECGTQNVESLVDSRFVVATLRARGVPVSFHRFVGQDHTWRMARLHAGAVLRFASTWFEHHSVPEKIRTPDVPRSWRAPLRA